MVHEAHQNVEGHPQCVSMDSVPSLTKNHHWPAVGPRGNHNGEALACSSARPSGMDVDIT